MANRRGKKEYPFMVWAIIPKGSSIGSKKKDTTRRSYHKTKESAIKEVNDWNAAGIKSNYLDRK